MRLGYVLLYLLGLIAPGLHLVTVEHVECPIGGELMHADDLAVADLCEESSPDDHDDSDSDDHSQHGCSVETARVAQITGHALKHANSWLHVSRAAAPIEVAPRAPTVALFRRAPKNSPPRV